MRDSTKPWRLPSGPHSRQAPPLSPGCASTSLGPTRSGSQACRAGSTRSMAWRSQQRSRVLNTPVPLASPACSAAHAPRTAAAPGHAPNSAQACSHGARRAERARLLAPGGRAPLVGYTRVGGGTREGRGRHPGHPNPPHSVVHLAHVCMRGRGGGGGRASPWGPAAPLPRQLAAAASGAQARPPARVPPGATVPAAQRASMAYLPVRK
jgi:hypothetical protein